jgi:carbamoyltransferase
VHFTCKEGVMSRVVLGIGGALGHDGNAALLVDGQLVAASQEERFSRIKHDARFPVAAIHSCLDMAGLSPSDVTVCVFAEKPLQSQLFDHTKRPSNWLGRFIGRITPEAWGSRYVQQARQIFPRAKFRYALHHFSHVAGAFHTSPFDRAAFLCVDGKGEDISASIGVVSHDRLEIRYQQSYENGLGLLYTLITLFLGFDSFGSEYKVMGLAPYGKSTYIEQLRGLLAEGTNGGVRLKQHTTFKPNEMAEALSLVEKVVGIKRVHRGSKLGNEHVDVAASLQALFEEEVLAMAGFAQHHTGEETLIFCGGCAQNCVTAGKLRDSGLFKDVFNSPVGGDMGTGLGAALLHEREVTRDNGKLRVNTRGYYLGPAPGEAPSEAAKYLLQYDGSLHVKVAQLLADGKIVGWVRGGMELGARALGARSILADPRRDDMQSMLNLKIKFRESFRPFAPAVLAEEAGRWFAVDYPSDYMQYTAYLRSEHRYPQPENFASLRDQLNFVKCAVPSIVHVDYSARLQTVDQQVHPDFHKLIEEFHKLTGVPLIINTSFNVNGQPIVCTAREAWECFLHTDIDILVLNDSIYQNPFDKTREEKLQWREQFEKFSK